MSDENSYTSHDWALALSVQADDISPHLASELEDPVQANRIMTLMYYDDGVHGPGKA